MARATRARVSKTSGAGVSRLSYQRGYSMGNRNTADSGTGVKFESGDREYAKSGKIKGDYPSGMNISYGETLFPTDLKDLESAYKGKPGKGLKLTPGKSKKLK
jgi:hypothetical protein